MWDWFQQYWSTMGLGAGIVLLVLLFFTNTLRSRLDATRWKDPVWLSWAMAVAYMLHNFEEYGIDAKGRAFYFPTLACHTFGFDNGQSCPLTPAFFISVNIPIVWICFVVAALWSRKNQAVGMAASAVLITNALSHIATLATPQGYSSGTVTAVVIFIPLSIWVLITCFGKGKVRYPVLGAIFVAAILAQGILLLMLRGLSTGTISEGAAITIMTIGSFTLLVIPWIAGRIWPTKNPSPAITH